MFKKSVRIVAQNQLRKRVKDEVCNDTCVWLVASNFKVKIDRIES